MEVFKPMMLIFDKGLVCFFRINQKGKYFIKPCFPYLTRFFIGAFDKIGQYGRYSKTGSMNGNRFLCGEDPLPQAMLSRKRTMTRLLYVVVMFQDKTEQAGPGDGPPHKRIFRFPDKEHRVVQITRSYKFLRASKSSPL